MNPTLEALTDARIIELFDGEFGAQDLDVSDIEVIAFVRGIESELQVAKDRRIKQLTKALQAFMVLDPTFSATSDALIAEMVDEGNKLAEAVQQARTALDPATYMPVVEDEPTAWYDPAAGAFYLSLEAIPKYVLDNHPISALYSALSSAPKEKE